MIEVGVVDNNGNNFSVTLTEDKLSSIKEDLLNTEIVFLDISDVNRGLLIPKSQIRFIKFNTKE